MSPRPLHEHNLQNTDECLLWLLDCTLATVEDLAMKKSAPKHEYSRQIGMAQTALNLLLREGKDVSMIRADQICKNFNRSVKDWAADIHSRFNP